MKPMTCEWVAKAEADFATAQRENRVRKSPNYDGICFHAQQCAEKYLKALLQERRVRFGKIHNLSELIGQLVEYYPTFNVLELAAKVLTDYAVAFRYPGKYSNKKSARQALHHCQLIREAVRLELGLSVNNMPFSKQRSATARRKKG